MSGDDIEAAIAALGAKFAAQLPDRLAQVKQHWSAAQAASDPADRGRALTDMHRIVHMLAGSAASFGFANLTAVARPLDTVLYELVEAEKALGSDEIARIDVAIAALEKVER